MEQTQRYFYHFPLSGGADCLLMGNDNGHKKHMKRTYCLMAFVLICLVVPPSTFAKRGKLFNCGESLHEGIEAYNRGRDNKATAVLQEVVYQCGGGYAAVDSALYYYGMSLLRSDRAAEAKSQFRRLVETHPDSPFFEEAHFRLGQSSFVQSNAFDRDQTETRQAIDELSDFVRAHPESPWVDSAQAYLKNCRDKLAHKDFASARFYHRIEKYDAAVVYYRTLMEEYPDSRFVPESKLYLAQALSRTNRVTEANLVVNDLLEGEYGEEIKRRAELLQQRLDAGE